VEGVDGFSRSIQADDKLWSLGSADLWTLTQIGTVNEQLEVVPYPTLAEASSITIKAGAALRNLSAERTSCPRD
jgi:hypothetical protein